MTPKPIVYNTARTVYLTPQAVAQYFGVSPMTINRLYHSGELQGIRVGRSIRIHVDELERFKQAAEMGESA